MEIIETSYSCRLNYSHENLRKRLNQFTYSIKPGIFILFTAALILSSTRISAQNKTGLSIGIQFPLNYSIRFDNKLTSKTSFSITTGIITKPFDRLILKTLNTLGTSEALTNTVGEAWNYGVSIQPSILYHFKRSHFGVSYSFVFLTASEAPIDAINNYYSLSLPRFHMFNQVEYDLSSNLHNTGLLYGYNIPFKNEKFGLKLEFSLLKTVSSKSKLTSTQTIAHTTAPDLIDEELNQYFKKYGFIPSLNLYLTINL